MTSCRSSGSSSLDRAVEPTKSQNITVSWRSSADGAPGVQARWRFAACSAAAGLRALRRMYLLTARIGPHVSLAASRRFWLESEGLLPCHLARLLKNFCDGFRTPAAAKQGKRPSAVGAGRDQRQGDKDGDGGNGAQWHDDLIPVVRAGVGRDGGAGRIVEHSDLLLSGSCPSVRALFLRGTTEV